MLKIYFCLLLSAIIPVTTFAQADTIITFTEVMFYSPQGNNEFIEIYNLSSTQTFDLTGYKIRYATSSSDQIVSAGEGMLLPPGAFAIIFEGDYDIENGIYAGLVPEEALLLKIADNSFGTNGMSNTSDRAIALVSPQNDSIDIYYYSANNLQGFTDEKRFLTRDNGPANWGNSKTLYGSPGKRNTITPYLYDIAITNIIYSPVPAITSSPITIFTTIVNEGYNTVLTAEYRLYEDVNGDSIPQQTELLYEEQVVNLFYTDSSIIDFTITNPVAGVHKIIAQILFPSDEDTSDNIAFSSFHIYDATSVYNKIIINEIMYAPTEGAPEWIELLNRSQDSLNIRNWKIFDLSSSSLLANNVIISPGEYIIITKDSAFFNSYPYEGRVIVTSLPVFNNDADLVKLTDSLGITVDSVLYSSSWGGSSGFSLERRHKDSLSQNQKNWGSSISPFRSTAGKINSITRKDYDLRVQSFNSTTYSIVHQPVILQTKIYNAGYMQTSESSIALYYDANSDSIAELSELIIQHQLSFLEPDDSVTFTDYFTPADTGIYHFISVILFAGDQDTTNNTAYLRVTVINRTVERNELVINEIMSIPSGDEPEWLEIYNTGNRTIQLKNFRIADARDTITVNKNTIFIPPAEYLVISDDSTITEYYGVISRLITAPLPSFNNSGDKIILLDSMNFVIDSLDYTTFPKIYGKSLERINALATSTDSLNWSYYRYTYRNGTPGKVNSVSQKKYDVLCDTIVFSKKFPVRGDTTKIYIQIKNIGTESLTMSYTLWEDKNNDSLPDAIIYTSLPQSIQPSAVLLAEIPVPYIVTEEVNLLSVVDAANDQDTLNNKFLIRLLPGYTNGSIIINEIMYNPMGGEPEWIELFNASDQVINIKDWTINDNFTTSSVVTIQENITLHPGDYLVLSRDSSLFAYRTIPSSFYRLNLPTLNNDKEGLVLRDSNGGLIDSIMYTSSMGGNNGKSLERITRYSSVWVTSQNRYGGTPGRLNSVTPRSYDLSLDSLILQPRFPQLHQNVRAEIVIRNNGTMTSAISEVKLQRLNEFSNEVLFNSQIPSLQPGEYFRINTPELIAATEEEKSLQAVIEQFDEDTSNNFQVVQLMGGVGLKSVIINEFMSEPRSGEPEWIEIKNTTSSPINISGWKILAGGQFTEMNSAFPEGTILLPEEYLIICSDSSFSTIWGRTVPYLVYQFGNLLNTGDTIALYDNRGAIIDTVYYNKEWKMMQGRSNERKVATMYSSAADNWHFSLNHAGASPGAINSAVFIKTYSVASLLINEILAEPSTGNSEFIELFNPSIDSINIGGWKLFSEGGEFLLSQNNYFIQPDTYFLLSSDSSLFSIYPTLNKETTNISIVNGSLGLSASGESIWITDANNNTIDSVEYFKSWHNPNLVRTEDVSLERISSTSPSNDKKNWSSSTDKLKATPGRRNSITLSRGESSADLSASPNPFSPDNDGYEDFTMLSFKTPFSSCRVTIEIYDDEGRKIRSLINGEYFPGSGEIIFDGRDDSRNPLRIGMYIVFLQAYDAVSGAGFSRKMVIVSARKL